MPSPMITVRLDRDTDKALRSYSRTRKISVSDVVRSAIASLLAPIAVANKGTSKKKAA